MKHTTLATVAGLAAALAAATPSFAVTVSTAFGNGADAQVSSISASLATPSDVGNNGTQLNTRFNYNATGSSNNDIIALRFDLTGYDLSTATDVSLTLFSFRDDGSGRSVEVIGVIPFTTGLDNNGTTAGFNTTNWNEASVKFSTMPGLEWDTNVSVTDFDIVAGSTTSLLTKSLSATPDLDVGSQVSFSAASFATFLQTHTTTNQVTFLLRAGSTSSGQARFATKESTSLDQGALPALAGTYAPYLTFTANLTAVPEPSAFAALAGVAGLALAGLRRRRR